MGFKLAELRACGTCDAVLKLFMRNFLGHCTNYLYEFLRFGAFGHNPWLWSLGFRSLWLDMFSGLGVSASGLLGFWCRKLYLDLKPKSCSGFL